MGMKQRLLLAVVIVAGTLSGMAWGAADDRFKGGGYDGYDKLSLAEQTIPAPPPIGTMVIIR